MAPAASHQVSADLSGRMELGQSLEDNFSEKHVYKGRFEGIPSVICYPRREGGSFKHEAHVLERLRGCPHVIGMHAFLEEQGCLILECVEPFGRADLSDILVRQDIAGRPLPLGQVRHYMVQLAHVCREMAARGVVHRDLKPDNVLIDRDHSVKVIDFGMAAVQVEGGTALNEMWKVRNDYSAPEVNSLPMKPAIDWFGLGGILYALCFGINLKTSQIVKWARSREGICGSMDGVHPDVAAAVEGLLCLDPTRRWGPEQVLEWASRAEVPEALPSDELMCWRPHGGECPQVIGARLPQGCPGSGRAIGDLDLMRIGGVQILLVDRYSEWRKFHTLDSRQRLRTAYRNEATDKCQWQPPSAGVQDPVAAPNASTILGEGDVVYFGVNSSGASTESLKAAISERLGLAEGLAEAIGDLGSFAPPSQDTCIEFVPELVYFKFPPHCANAVLGQACHKGVGQNALNLRSAFGVNVAALVRADGSVSWWPGASEAQGGLVGHGDGALLCKVPQWEGAGPPRLSASVEDLRDVLDVTRFKRRLGLDTDDVAWYAWQHNARGKHQ